MRFCDIKFNLEKKIEPRCINLGLAFWYGNNHATCRCLDLIPDIRFGFPAKSARAIPPRRTINCSLPFSRIDSDLSSGEKKEKKEEEKKEESVCDRSYHRPQRRHRLTPSEACTSLRSAEARRRSLAGRMRGKAVRQSWSSKSKLGLPVIVFACSFFFLAGFYGSSLLPQVGCDHARPDALLFFVFVRFSG